MDKLSLGRKAEAAAAEYLTQQGYAVLEMNYTYTGGEIDIVAEQGSVLVFVEVRSRQGTRFGLPQETVNYIKQQKVRKAADHYLKVKRAWDRVCRFDVIGVLFNEKGRIIAIELIQDAF